MNISNLVKETFDNGGDVWIGSDLHLMKMVDGWKLTDDYKITRALGGWTIHDEDMVIFLGDLADDNVPDHDVELFLEKWNTYLPKNKVFIRGNNDMMDNTTLESLGWKVCYSAFIESNILDIPQSCVLSHCPLELNGWFTGVFNIHGHIHKQNWDPLVQQRYTLWEPTTPDRCINVGEECFEGHLLDINYVVSSYKCKLEKLKNDPNWEFYPKPMKPGMSRYLANQALDEFRKDYKEL